jgi:hypothetical protein
MDFQEIQTTKLFAAARLVGALEGMFLMRDLMTDKKDAADIQRVADLLKRYQEETAEAEAATKELLAELVTF